MAESTLASAMQRLRGLASRDWSETARGYELRPHTALAKAVEGLGDAVGGGVRVSRLERARAAWVRRHNSGAQLSRMEIAALCWDPKIAVDAEFAGVLGKQPALGGRAIRGLLASHHEGWPPPTRDLEPVLSRGLANLERARGPLLQWRSITDQLVGIDAPLQFARACQAEKLSITARTTALGLSATSGFARSCAGVLADIVTNPANARLHIEYALRRVFVEDDALLNPVSWGRAFEELVTNDRLLVEGLDRQRLVDLALQVRGLPDPRIRSAGWQNVPTAARQRVVHWLSEEDLRFFFDLIMEGQADPQGRHRFWVDYVGRAHRARVVVGVLDHQRLLPQLDAIELRGRSYARMRRASGSDSQISAFIMDFGDVTVVEFSRVNSACYVYQNRGAEPYIDLSAHGFSLYQLKDRRHGRWYSHGRGWEFKFQKMLSEYGVRPE